MTSLAKNLSLLGVMCVVCFLLAEGALRIALPPDASGWRGVPALEDRVADLPPLVDGEVRILALGDSFTEYRDHVGENWVRYAEEAVRASGTRVVSMNLGQMGTGPRHYLKNLREFGAAAKPDIVVVGLYLGNDVLDYELDLEKKRRGMEPSPVVTFGRRSSGLSGALKRHSRLVSTTLDAITAVRGRGTFEPNLQHVSDLYGLSQEEVSRRLRRIEPDIVELARRDGLNTWDLAFGIVTPQRYRTLLFLEDSDVNIALQAFLQDLNALAEESRALGATCVFLLIPIGPQVDPRYQEYLHKVGFDTSEQMAADTPLVKRLHRFFEDKRSASGSGPFVVDPLPELRASPEELYLPMDTHWTPKAQRIAGEKLATALAEAGLLKAR